MKLPLGRVRRRSGRGGLLTGLIVVAAVGIIAGGGYFLFRDKLSELTSKPEKQLAEANDSGRKEEPASRSSHDPELDLPILFPKSTKKNDPPKNDLPRTDPTTKKTEPPKNPDPTTKPDKPPKPDLPIKTGPLPRRALAISINNYLFANPINYGTPIRTEHNVQTLLEVMTHTRLAARPRGPGSRSQRHGPGARRPAAD